MRAEAARLAPLAPAALPSLPALPALPALPSLRSLCRARSVDVDLDGLGRRALPLRPAGALRARAPCRAARRRQRSAARIAIASVLGAFPFWPAGLVLPLACAGAALALVSPWLAAAFTLAICVPALGDVSAGLAWCAALAGGLWLARLRCERAAARCCPAAAPVLAALFLWPLYVLAAGCLRTRRRPRAGRRSRAVRDRALGRRAAGRRPGRQRRRRASSAAALLDAARCAAAAAGRRLGDRRGACCRTCWPRRDAGLWMSVWLTGLLIGQTALPALAGAAPEPPGRSVVAIWAVAILLVLGVRAPDDDAPAGTPVSAEE